MEHDNDPSARPASKSQLKRDAHALQKLGIDLLQAPESDWLELQLPEDLISALKAAKRMPSRGAHKRQLQLIGKLMRGIDADPIQQYFEQRRLDARRQARIQHRLESWRDRIIAEGDSAIDAYLDEHPGADRQRLRQLARQAKKEQSKNKPPKASRALFRYLRGVD